MSSIKSSSADNTSIIYNIEQNSELLFERLKLFICMDIVNYIEYLSTQADNVDLNKLIHCFIPFLMLFFDDNFDYIITTTSSKSNNYKNINYNLFKTIEFSYTTKDINNKSEIIKCIINIIKYIFLSSKYINLDYLYGQICINIYLYETKSATLYENTSITDKMNSILHLIMRLFSNTLSYYLYNLKYYDLSSIINGNKLQDKLKQYQIKDSIDERQIYNDLCNVDLASLPAPAPAPPSPPSPPDIKLATDTKIIAEIGLNIKEINRLILSIIGNVNIVSPDYTAAKDNLKTLKSEVENIKSKHIELSKENLTKLRTIDNYNDIIDKLYDLLNEYIIIAEQNNNLSPIDTSAAADDIKTKYTSLYDNVQKFKAYIGKIYSDILIVIKDIIKKIKNTDSKTIIDEINTKPDIGSELITKLDELITNLSSPVTGGSNRSRRRKLKGGVDKLNLQQITEICETIYYKNIGNCNDNKKAEYLKTAKILTGGDVVKLANISFENPLYLLNHVKMDLCKLEYIYNIINNNVIEKIDKDKDKDKIKTAINDYFKTYIDSIVKSNNY